MKKNFSSFAFGALFFSAGLFLSSCTTETGEDKPVAPGTFEKGVFVTNEGQFQKSNGAVSFISRQTNKVDRDLFMAVNNRPLGDVVQSMTIHNGKAYVVVNNSKKVEVADANTFKEAGVINGLEMPRYAVGLNNKLYVTEWVGYGVDGRVSVIDLTTNTVSKTITVGESPEKVLLLNNKLYVVNSGDNTVSVINTVTDAVETTITVSHGPNSLVVDAGNNIWVLCGGEKVYDSNWNFDLAASTAGSLVQIDPASNTVTQTLNFTSKADIPGNLTINSGKNKLYYKYEGKIYQMETTAPALPATAFINRDFSGLGIDPETNIIYGAITTSFTTNGKVIRYTPAGAAQDSFTVAIGPNNFLFR
ncbi:YncE family protein [Adhaeribacter terreus]|uniref:YncE family protein n=1 Tax=Adhaeribacter terreus TaxID=529703 RepID=A0ABW0E716_9BACT